jgi:putative transposase
MNEHLSEFSILSMCHVFCVSKAGFYAWKKRPASVRRQADARLLPLIKASFKRGREAYGYRRVHDDLRDQCGKANA